jgi:D-3-phosphoglycerate dehydrogenase
VAHKVVVATRSFGSTSDEPWDLLAENDCEVLRVDITGATEEELGQALREAEGFIVGGRPVSGELIAGAEKLKVISMHGVGFDHIDLEAAREHGVMIANCPEANFNSVADLTLGLMIAVAREIPRAIAALARGEWGRFVGVEVWKKTLGIVGLGRIGRAVAGRAAGFEMRILVHDPYVSTEGIERAGGQSVGFDELLDEADFLSLHAPLSDETRHLVDEQALQRMKPTAFLINTARGELVDEEALYRALQKGAIAGAALDVFTEEPPGDNPLIGLPNVLATPHIGAHSQESTTNASVMAARNIVEALKRGEPVHRVV